MSTYGRRLWSAFEHADLTLSISKRAYLDEANAKLNLVKRLGVMVSIARDKLEWYYSSGRDRIYWPCQVPGYSRTVFQSFSNAVNDEEQILHFDTCLVLDCVS